ncbi:MAG TPA: glycosyl transferase, partial [Cyanobacteria bacterium UBA9971]|nr:glycosyl transferase [Cyanobacteria bacterium UBA9971]
GLIYSSVEEFEEKLVKLIEDVNFRRELANNAYNYVSKNRLLSMHFQERADWYQEMLGNLPKLNEELRSRAPELFKISK